MVALVIKFGTPEGVLKRNGLDTQAEVYVLLVACVCVGVVWSAVIELIALAELAADEEAQSYCTQTGGDPAYSLDERRILFVFREWGRRSRHDGDFVGLVIGDAAVGEEPHAMDDSAG
jgi:hypothetical protein